MGDRGDEVGWGGPAARFFGFGGGTGGWLESSTRGSAFSWLRREGSAGGLATAGGWPQKLPRSLGLGLGSASSQGDPVSDDFGRSRPAAIISKGSSDVGTKTLARTLAGAFGFWRVGRPRRMGVMASGLKSVSGWGAAGARRDTGGRKALGLASAGTSCAGVGTG